MSTLYNRETFRTRERICGAARHSVILKGDNGERIYCSNSLFNKIMQDPTIEFRVVTLQEHESRDRFGNDRWFGESKWIEAFLPSRF